MQYGLDEPVAEQREEPIDPSSTRTTHIADRGRPQNTRGVVNDVHDGHRVSRSDNSATPQRERLEFSRIPLPNDNWMVWFGMADDFPWAFHHYGWLIAGRDDAAVSLSKPPSLVLPRCNMQSTAIRAGKLLVLTYSSRSNVLNPEIDPTLFAVTHGLHLIWPSPMAGLNANPVRRLTKTEVIEVTWQFARRLDSHHPKPTWPSQPEPRSSMTIGRRYSPLIK